MSLTDDFLTVKEALQYLSLNGIDYHEVHFRALLGTGAVKSKKVFSSRVVSRASLNSLLDRKKK